MINQPTSKKKFVLCTNFVEGILQTSKIKVSIVREVTVFHIESASYKVSYRFCELPTLPQQRSNYKGQSLQRTT